MKVLKFGGSSVSSPDRIRDVARIVLDEAKKDRVIVVVSAFQGVTNQLLECARLAEADDGGYLPLYDRIAQRHSQTLVQLLGKSGKKSNQTIVQELLGELQNVLKGINLLRHCPPRALDVVASFGERLSAFIFSSFLNRRNPSSYVDARGLVITDDLFTRANVLFDQTNSALQKHFRQLFARSSKKLIPVVTGFIGATEDGRTTTIGRNGSDYSAAIIGAALKASIVEIWTDVDGILSADPQIVPSAFVLPRMSYEEAMELSYFGAKVLHSATIAPAVARKIPILIKNTLNPSAPGTLISDRVDDWEAVAKGITSIDAITLFTLRGLSMVGVPGTAQRLFHALADHRVNVILISQASSEHTICFAVSSSDGVRVRKAIAHEFRYEFQNRMTALDEIDRQTIVAIVGEGMKGTPGVAGKVFQALGRNSVNISAIAQGASERNISFVISASQKVRALNVVHQAFFEKKKHLSLVVVGVGNIGSALLRQIHQQQPYLRSQGYEVSVCGISDSKRYLVSPHGVSLTHWREALTGSPQEKNPVELAGKVAALQLTNTALIDCTASAEIVAVYPDFVKANMHIITPNKKANVLPWKQYNALMTLMKDRQKYFLYEANVGAGLPVISTIQDLIASGDTIVTIEGIFSGTLSYLFNTFDGRKPFSKLVAEARERGFTEPDPREDLSGQDVGRKLLILARQINLKMDLKDIRIENLVPPSLSRGVFSDQFYKKYSLHDAAIEKRHRRARQRGTVLRYVGTLKNGKGSAGLREFPPDHPFASTKGTDNIIAFTTHRYATTPLVIQGPGAGADVTAMGVFSDILKLLHYLPY
ncbi:MAG TPA: bifunctional aspartate kinase/homoserine dehydrogenase I [Bacteroidota bacterium]|jgi:aspartokinase/homoserine dehydrogenase 1|nr:bifunctional aspartate kinase/homoserine dehydrogenase I [Bacteroidota bacterium]